MTFRGSVAQDNADSAVVMRHSVWKSRWSALCHPRATPNCPRFMRLLPCCAFSIMFCAWRPPHNEKPAHLAMHGP